MEVLSVVNVSPKLFCINRGRSVYAVLHVHVLYGALFC